MTEQGLPIPPQSPERLRHAAAVFDDLVTGSRKLRQAFMQAQTRFAGRDASLIDADEPDAGAVLIRSGFAYRSCVLPDGRRAILDILAPGDIAGVDHIVLSQPAEEISAAGRVNYQALSAAALRDVALDPAVALSMLAIVAEKRWRADRLAASIGRLNARTRICVMLLDLYDRLRRRGLIDRPRFNLPLTQEQIADHLGLTLVHVNRTLRRLREDRVVLLDHQVVSILNIDELRRCAQGLPQPADIPDSAVLPELRPAG